MDDDKKIVEIFIKAAVSAGDYVREFRKKYDLGISYKSDNSPLTKADMGAHHQILDFLQKHLPYIPVISEEHIISLALSDEYFILLDPIDGTRNYMKGDNDYTINIALIKNNRPIIGVIYVPEEDMSFYAIEKQGAFQNHRNNLETSTSINVNHRFENGLTATLSGRAEQDRNFAHYALKYPVENVIFMGSAKKFTLIAKGDADLYPRSGPTGEWDTAAGDILIHEAGGIVHDLNGMVINYRKENFLNSGFIALSGSKILI